ncbi:MAG: PRC-barrel domain-containing protein [Verrucomicrobiota bacterium]
MMRNAKDLKNFKLGALDGDIGRVKDFYFDDAKWVVRYLVADTGTWLPERQVLISPWSLQRVDESSKLLHVSLTRDQIEKSPGVETEKPVSRQFEIEYYRYYGWPYYWTGPALWGVEAYPYFGYGIGPVLEEPRRDAGDPHLRSTHEVTGYHIHARDGEIGHVEDFVIDDMNWAIRYLAVDTRNWWPGKKVLLAPQWIDAISWEKSMVEVHLPRSVIQGAPEFDMDKPISREYEQALWRYYDREGYWLRETPPAARAA